jgi:hypothetical protein
MPTSGLSGEMDIENWMNYAEIQSITKVGKK